MENAELMQKEIENKRKLPQEIKQEIYKNIFCNLLIAIIIIIYLCVINILFYKLPSADFEQKMKFFALGIIIITVGAFEIAYRRDSKRICIIGIELFICSILSLYIPYIYLHTSEMLRKITMIFPVALSIYYMVKSFAIYKTRKFKHENNLSDVKEILKDTEKNSYLEEESKKTYRENQKIEEKIKKELIEEQKLRKIKKKELEKQKLNKKQETNNKKQTQVSKKKTSKKKK